MKIMKKLLSLSLVFAMMLAVFGIMGCGEKPHTHAYEEFYSVSADKQNAFKITACDCGEIKNKTEILNAVIVNPQTAQAELDKNINGKTIIFDKGTYSDLIIRPTRETVEHIYEYDKENPTIKGEEIELKDVDLTKTTIGYHYERTLENIVFAGTKEATFEGIFTIESANVGYGELETTQGLPETGHYTDQFRLGLSQARKDVIRNLELTNINLTYGWTDISYFAHIPMENITFDGMKFGGKHGRIFVYEGSVDETQKNLVIQNCKFLTDEAHKSGHQYYEMKSPAVSVYTRSAGFFENVVFKNNVISGHFQGIVVLNGKNVTIENNKLSNTEHNALALHGASALERGAKGTYTTGTIVIKNNDIKNTGVGVATGERAIRFASFVDAAVQVEDNKFSNCAEDRTGEKYDPSEGVQLLASSTLTRTSYSFKNNSYNGTKLQDDVQEDKSVFIIYIEEPIIE